MCGTAWRKGFIHCLYGAIPAPILCDNLDRHRPSNRTESLLAYTIQSHTNPKRRKGFMKQAGHRVIKRIAERRKKPKRTVKCRLKVQKHSWEQDTGNSSLPNRTSLGNSKNATLIWRNKVLDTFAPPSMPPSMLAARPPPLPIISPRNKLKESIAMPLHFIQTKGLST